MHARRQRDPQGQDVEQRRNIPDPPEPAPKAGKGPGRAGLTANPAAHQQAALPDGDRNFEMNGERHKAQKHPPAILRQTENLANRDKRVTGKPSRDQQAHLLDHPVGALLRHGDDPQARRTRGKQEPEAFHHDAAEQIGIGDADDGEMCVARGQQAARDQALDDDDEPDQRHDRQPEMQQPEDQAPSPGQQRIPPAREFFGLPRLGTGEPVLIPAFIAIGFPPRRPANQPGARTAQRKPQRRFHHEPRQDGDGQRHQNIDQMAPAVRHPGERPQPVQHRRHPRGLLNGGDKIIGRPGRVVTDHAGERQADASVPNGAGLSAAAGAAAPVSAASGDPGIIVLAGFSGFFSAAGAAAAVCAAAGGGAAVCAAAGVARARARRRARG